MTISQQLLYMDGLRWAEINRLLWATYYQHAFDLSPLDHTRHASIHEWRLAVVKRAMAGMCGVDLTE